MKFSLIYEAQMADTSREKEAQVFHDMVEQCLLAEALGFDVIWCVEHHTLRQYSHMASPETFLAFIAGRTKRIHVGHGVVCLPHKMNHPVKVAERVATLDILSKGRVHFGMGKGSSQQELGTFDIHPDLVTPQVDESMYMIPKMWQEGFFEHKSDFITIPSRPIHPKPYQKPHPPLYMATTRDEGIADAGHRGIGALIFGFAGPAETARKNEIYRKAYRERDLKDQVGFRPTEHVAALCPTVILGDRDQARRIGLRGQRFFFESAQQWYKDAPPPSVEDLTPEQLSEEIKRTEDRLMNSLDLSGEALRREAKRLCEVYHIEEDAYGTVTDAVAYIEKLIGTGIDEILFLVQMGSVSHAASMETIRNLGRFIIPSFRSEAGNAPSAKRAEAI